MDSHVPFAVNTRRSRALESFIKAGEAVAARDSNGFATHVRELKRNGLAVENPRNFFTAK